MTDTKQKSSLRPSLRPYLWTIGLTLVLWLGFVIIVYLKAQETDVELRDIHSVVRWSITGILAAALLAYSGHWWGNAVAHEKAELAAYKSEVITQNAEQEAARQRTYSLEIRGAGIGIYEDHQSEIWDFVKKKNNNFVSIFSRDPKDYDPSLDAREISADIKLQVAFKHSASESVAYWPIPVFALGPPKETLI
ncbi:DUF2875 family protein, partial [Pseudomonas amygdali]